MSALQPAVPSCLALALLAVLAPLCRAEVVCTVYADSQHSRYAPARATDGDASDMESRWASAKAPGPHWLRLQLAEPVEFDAVRITGHAGDLALSDLDLQVLGPAGWTTVSSVRNNAEAVIRCDTGERTAREVRLFVTRACERDDCARVFEVELLHHAERVALTLASGWTPQPTIGPEALRECVTPLPPIQPAGGAGTQVTDTIWRSVADWSEILDSQQAPAPTVPGATYYGLGRNVEDDIRPTCYAAMVYAFLCVTPPVGEPPSEERRAAWRDSAIRTMRYLVACHQTGTEQCPGGGQWGDQWQSAMWCRALGMAAWMLWGSIDPDLQADLARVIEFEADRFPTTPLRSSEFENTGAEENAWDAQIVSLAANMMPGHPRAAAWEEAAKRGLYNSLSVAADADDPTPGDDHRAINDWVSTVNAHSDYTVENHGLVHVGYLKTTMALMLESAPHYLLTGREVPAALRHHVADAFEVLLSCMSWDAAPIYFGGNDWKVYHTQDEDLMMYSLLSVVGGDGRAATLEPMALEHVVRTQELQGGYYNVRRDIEFGGMVATRLIGAYLAHALGGEGADPVAAGELDAACAGIRLLSYGRAVLHRTPTKFASFAWGPKCMALAMPRDGTWVVWPRFESYTGRVMIEGQDRAPSTSFTPVVTEDAFAVTGTLSEYGGAVTRDIAYVSPPGDATVYIERLTAPAGAAWEGGIVGLEYPLGGNERVLEGAFGSLEAQGTGGDATRVVPLESDWLCIADQVGYVIRRSPEGANGMRYHDEVSGEGRVPTLQEWISLAGNADGLVGSPEPSWTCIVTFLNEDSEAVRRERVAFAPDGARATVEAAGYVVEVDFAAGTAEWRAAE